MIVTRRLDAGIPDDVVTAADILRGGGVVALPTETVYGLAADASNGEAVRRIFTIKGRPRNHPLIVHVADVSFAEHLASDWTPAADVLARRFWPGPLSILVDKNENVPDDVTGGRPSVVVRIPAVDATVRLLRILHEMGSIGVAAPSANKFGAVSPTTAAHVIEDLGGLVDAVLDGGRCTVGVESTIVDCRSDQAVLLREGGITFEQIVDELGIHELNVVRSLDLEGSDDSSRAVAPGMLTSHYAPRARVEVFERDDELSRRHRQLEVMGIRCVLLPHPSDITEYSRDLYASMRSCDSPETDVILALLPEPKGLGAAVRDRLRKAAAPR